MDDRPLYKKCKKHVAEKKYNKQHTTSYRPLCSYCRRPYTRGKGKKRVLKMVCARCGFIPEHPCQLDIHHLDSNHKNNEEGNLQVLCANCHRLITFMDGAGIYRS